MKHMLKSAVCFLLLAVLSTASWANERPVLRSQVMTLSEIVTIGDFYSNTGALTTVPLFRSPDMGTSGDVPATLVAERARAAGLEMAGTDGLRTVVVHRGATKIDHQHLKHLVRTSLSDGHADVDPSTLDIALTQAPDQVLADPKASTPVRVTNSYWARSTGQFTMTLSVAGEHGRQQIPLAGKAVEMIEVAVLAQPLRRGEILKPQDLTTLRLPKRKISSAALYDGTEVVGQQARVNLRANQPIANKDFQQPVIVKRGDNVTVTFQIPGMKLTSRAQALDNGAKGDVIDVMNIQSRRVVPAIVLSRGQVRVHAANPVIASLNRETHND